MDRNVLIDAYLASARQLREGVAGLSAEQLKLRPIAGKWLTLEVICHLADFDIVYADRIKRVIAEERPNLPGGDQNLFAVRLAYHDRDADNELALVDAIHRQVAAILRASRQTIFSELASTARPGR